MINQFPFNLGIPAKIKESDWIKYLYALSPRGRSIWFLGTNKAVTSPANILFTSGIENDTNGFWGSITHATEGSNEGRFTFSQPGTWYVIVNGWSTGSSPNNYYYESSGCTFKTANNASTSNGWQLPLGSDTDNVTEQSAIVTVNQAGAYLIVRQTAGSGAFLNIRFMSYNSVLDPTNIDVNVADNS